MSSWNRCAITPFRIEGTVKIDGQNHKLELIYAHSSLRSGDKREGRMDRPRPVFYGVFLDGKDIGTYQYDGGGAVMGKNFPGCSYEGVQCS